MFNFLHINVFGRTQSSFLIWLTDFVCSGRGATTGGGVSSSSSSSPSLPPDGEVAVPCLPGYNSEHAWLKRLVSELKNAWCVHLRWKCRIHNVDVEVMNGSTHRLGVFIWKRNDRVVSLRSGQHWIFVSLLRERKLTRGGETEVFLFSTGGVVEFENVEDGLRILFLLWFTDVGSLKETGPLLRHTLDKQTHGHHTHGATHSNKGQKKSKICTLNICKMSEEAKMHVWKGFENDKK